MKFARFSLEAGKINSLQHLEATELDPELLLKATETLTKLRASAVGALLPVPGIASYWIGLGMPPNLYEDADTSTISVRGLCSLHGCALNDGRERSRLVRYGRRFLCGSSG